MDAVEGRKRCGETKRHTPHWHNIEGSRTDWWCDGRYYAPTDKGNQMIEQPGRTLDN